MAQRFFTPQQLQHWAKEEPARLLAAALTQVDQLQRRAQQLKEARARIGELESLLQSAQQASFRQAAPFRVAQQKRSATPKRPGRKAGHPGACRARPAQIDQEITIELSACPQCGAQQWIDQEEIEQFIEEIPKMRPL